MSTSIVTGANRGIGLQLCAQLSHRGDDVVAVCRTASPQLEELGVRVESGVDVTDQGSVERLVQRLADVEIDLLINNAGILTSESLSDLDFDRIRKQLEVNSLGPLRVTAALLPRMSKGSKVAIITSRMGSISDNTSGSRYGYRMSKAAVNAAGKSLAMDLQPQGIAVTLLHPGFVRTEMTGNNGMVDADESARGLLARIDELTIETTGTFWHMNGEVLPW
jgi:NAD(P)-dependent dehydrogenase (short-subunit alcohol dehydrogenase family)